jgi:SPP1 gp7 family putative phage head morphogenesis protein
MASTAKQTDLTVQRQVYLEGLKAGQVKEYGKFLRKMDKVIRDQLSRGEITDLNRQRLREQLALVDGLLADIYTTWDKKFQATLKELSFTEATFEAQVLGQVSGVTFAIPSPNQVASAVFVEPLAVRGYTGDKLLRPMLKQFTKAHQKEMTAIIRQGYFEGASNVEILRRIRGSSGAKFRDGALGKNNRHAKAIISTAVQHSASVARFKTWEENDDIIAGYRWVSTLDSRTSPQCRSLDGMVFKVGEGPRPPVHINCRSTTVAEFEDDLKFLQGGRSRAFQPSTNPPKGDESYYSWLKRQPNKFQEDVIGVKRAKLLRDGGVSADEFARLNLNRNFEAISLGELEKKAPMMFEAAEL